MGPGKPATETRSRPSAVGPGRVVESLQLARAEADRLDRRQRVLTLTSSAVLAILAIRAVVGLLVPTLNPGGSALLLAAPLALGFAAALVGLIVARRWARRLADLRQDIFWLEFVRAAMDHESISPVMLHPYRLMHEEQDTPVLIVRRPELLRDERTADRPATPPRRRWEIPVWRAASMGVAALVAGLVLAMASLRDTSEPERYYWTFTERENRSLRDLGFITATDQAGTWLLQDHEHATGGRALVNYAGQPNERPALAVTAALRPRDVRVATRCKVKSPGTACGLVFRFHDPENHYVAHVNAASGHVSLCAVIAGFERTIQELSADISRDIWQELAVEARADNIVVSWNGKRVIDVHDPTLSNAGGVGLWVPAADVAFFDELSVEYLPSSPHPMDLFPFLLKRRT